MIDLLDRLSVNAKIAAQRREADAVKRTNRAVRERGISFSVTSRSEVPRAIICVTAEAFCTNCGARYRAPSTMLLADYGDNLTSTLRTQDELLRYPSDILREHRTRSVNVPACEKCF